MTCPHARRRWCKGNLQNTFSRDCTLFDLSQPVMLRILWNAVTWHYLTCSVYTPTFLMVPILAIMAGIFPIALNRVFALAFTLYFCTQQIVRAPPLPSTHTCMHTPTLLILAGAPPLALNRASLLLVMNITNVRT